MDKKGIDKLLETERLDLIYRHAVLDDNVDAIYAAKKLIDFYVRNGKWTKLLRLSDDIDIPAESKGYAKDTIFYAFLNFLTRKYPMGTTNTNEFGKDKHTKSFSEKIGELKIMLNGRKISKLDKSLEYKKAIVSKIIALTLNLNQDLINILQLPLDLILKTDKNNLVELAKGLYPEYEKMDKDIPNEFNDHLFALIGLYHPNNDIKFDAIYHFVSFYLPKNTGDSLSSENIKPLLNLLRMTPENSKKQIYDMVINTARYMLADEAFTLFSNLFRLDKDNNLIKYMTQSNDLPASFGGKRSNGNGENSKRTKRRRHV